ncbi:hypothetical protein JTL96_36460, partial [Pseudomonas aeruginosa]|nr:hypothetical protein [Pseudomonas aeruginosa]
ASAGSAGSASANNSQKALRINSLSTAIKVRASYRQIAPAVLVKNGIQRRQRNYCARKSRSSVRRGPVVSSSCAEKRWLSPITIILRQGGAVIVFKR